MAYHRPITPYQGDGYWLDNTGMNYPYVQWMVYTPGIIAAKDAAKSFKRLGDAMADAADALSRFKDALGDVGDIDDDES